MPAKGQTQVSTAQAGAGGTHTVMLRLPEALFTQLQNEARRQTLAPAVLARVLVREGLARCAATRRDGEGV